MPELIAIGAANVDFVAKVDRFPKPDDEVSIKQLGMYGGGSAANVAVGVSRLGHPSGFMGLIGTDQFGEFLVKEFEKDGVDISGVKRIEGSSGTAISVVNKKGERMLFASIGVSENFDRSFVNEESLKDAKYLHLTSLEGEHVLDAFELVSEKAKSRGIKVIFDPGCILAEKGAEALTPILKNCFATLPNKVEAEMLTGTTGEEAARKLLETGVENVIITQGLGGCVLGNKDGVKTIPFVPKMGKKKAVDLTGCGDAFAAALITALLENRTLEKAIEFGMQIGHMGSGIMGARCTPKRKEIPEEIMI